MIQLVQRQSKWKRIMRTFASSNNNDAVDIQLFLDESDNDDDDDDIDEESIIRNNDCKIERLNKRLKILKSVYVQS